MAIHLLFVWMQFSLVRERFRSFGFLRRKTSRITAVILSDFRAGNSMKIDFRAENSMKIPLIDGFLFNGTKEM